MISLTRLMPAKDQRAREIAIVLRLFAVGSRATGGKLSSHVSEANFGSLLAWTKMCTKVFLRYKLIIHWRSFKKKHIFKSNLCVGLFCSIRDE